MNSVTRKVKLLNALTPGTFDLHSASKPSSYAVGWLQAAASIDETDFTAELSSERENMLFQELDDEMRPLPVARSSRLTAVFKTMTTEKSVRRLNLMESQFSYTSVEKYNPLVNTNRFFPSQDQRFAYVVMRC